MFALYVLAGRQIHAHQALQVSFPHICKHAPGSCIGTHQESKVCSRPHVPHDIWRWFTYTSLEIWFQQNISLRWELLVEEALTACIQLCAWVLNALASQGSLFKFTLVSSCISGDWWFEQPVGKTYGTRPSNSSCPFQSFFLSLLSCSFCTFLDTGWVSNAFHLASCAKWHLMDSTLCQPCS